MSEKGADRRMKEGERRSAIAKKRITDVGKDVHRASDQYEYKT